MKFSSKEKILNIVLSIIFLSLSIFVFLALITFDINDNNFFQHNSDVTKVENLMGPLGANVSVSLIKALGIVKYFIPLVFFGWFLKLLVQKEPPNLINIAFLPLSILLMCFLVTLIVKNDFYSFKFESGFVGDGLYEYVNNFYSNILKSLIENSIFIFIYICLLFLSTGFTIGLSISFYSNVLINLVEVLYYLIMSIVNLFIKKRKLPKLNLSIFKRRNMNLKKNISAKVKSNSVKSKFDFNYKFPEISLLENPSDQKKFESENYKNVSINKTMLENVLGDFNIKGNIISFKQGPIVTLYELKPAPGTKTSTVISLSDDIARSMSSISSRISAIPGRDAIGIEIPNKQIQTVYLRELIDSTEYKRSNLILPLVLGKNILGKPVIVDLAKMPHLLVAGTTGSGKSVGINAMILSLLYNCTPEDCRLILIDPKMLELSIYRDIPHLLTEVVTDTKKAITALKWAVKEMEKRYQLMSHIGVRNIESYNERIRLALDKGSVIEKEVQLGFDQETGKPIFEKKQIDLKIFPKIVVVVDELADLMITSGREIEATIQRLSQMARAAGIHLIVATQRPSVDVITGTIKSNFPSRISYQVTSKIDSRTILGEQGGEQLLGKGDLLLTMTGERLTRVHGPFVMTHEVEAVVNHLRQQGDPDYLDSVTEEDSENDIIGLDLERNDELYNQAVSIVCREKKASTSFIQRHLSIGYNRAANIIEKMEKEGIVSPANHVGRREVLVGKDI